MAYRTVLASILLVALSECAQAQSVIDGSEATVGAETAEAALALIGRQLRSPDARVAGLKKGRAGGLCGTIDVRNRMGTYTGPRAFVVDLAQGLAGRLPEGPELRSPASMADFRAMERIKALFAENCVEP